jgi:hypothetical protein
VRRSKETSFFAEATKDGVFGVSLNGPLAVAIDLMYDAGINDISEALDLFVISLFVFVFPRSCAWGAFGNVLYSSSILSCNATVVDPAYIETSADEG